jgi:hypothetical protein
MGSCQSVTVTAQEHTKAMNERRYQVFISSTFRDLQSERQKVLQAVLELRAFPTGMEMFPAADDEQWQFIQQEILSSDYYVVVVAGKYGSLAEDGQSFTEKEYDFATNSGKPVMGFLVRELGDLKGSKLEEEQAKRDKLQAFRNKVSRGKLVKFYRTEDELKAQVMQALVHAFQFKPREGWVRSQYSRRIEDLEAITSLQKRVMELEAENRALIKSQEDPRERFMNEPMEGEIKLEPIGALAPPVEVFSFKTTWTDLFIACLERGYPTVGRGAVHESLSHFLVGRLDEEFPDSNDWLEDGRFFPTGQRWKGFEDSSFLQVVHRIRRRLIGVGFIDIVRHATYEEWVVTEKGRLYMVILEAHKERGGTGDSLVEG